MRTRDWAIVDFYAILGVAPTASAEEIAGAFRGLAKQLHPDRVGESSPESERFKSVTAAYEVVGDARLRRNYDQVRAETRTRSAPSAPGGAFAARPAGAADAGASAPVPVPPELARRRGRRWIAAGLAVSLTGIVVAILIVHLQIDEHVRREGRVETEAQLVVSGTTTEVQFTTAAGSVVRVPEPTPVDPGTVREGQTVKIMYRPGRPTDVILDESTAARDITLWVVALKLLVGGPVFLGVGIHRLRNTPRPAPVRG